MRSEVGSQEETERGNKNGKSLLTLRALNMVVGAQLPVLRNQVDLDSSVDITGVQRSLNHPTGKYARDVSPVISRVANVKVC